MTPHFWFTMITNIISPNPIPHMVIQFFWFIYIDKHNLNQGIGKGDRHKIRNFKHEGKHKIGRYPRYLLILAAYQLKW